MKSAGWTHPALASVWTFLPVISNFEVQNNNKLLHIIVNSVHSNIFRIPWEEGKLIFIPMTILLNYLNMATIQIKEIFIKIPLRIVSFLHIFLTCAPYSFLKAKWVPYSQSPGEENHILFLLKSTGTEFNINNYLLNLVQFPYPVVTQLGVA